MKISRIAVCAGALALGSACNLLNVTDNEQAVGRGANVFDPYDPGAGTTTLRLSLQWFNGCSVLPTGEPVANPGAGVPYPDFCGDPRALPDPELPVATPNGANCGAVFPCDCSKLESEDFDEVFAAVEACGLVEPSGVMTILTNRSYFLNQLTLMDTVINRHKEGTTATDLVRWYTTESRFKNLDWTNVGVNLDTYRPDGDDIWSREMHFASAAWMLDRNDTFTIEVLDAAGNVVPNTTVVYDRDDFLAENATSGHTRISWRTENLYGAPAANNPPDDPPHFHTTARVDLVTSTNPFIQRQINLPDSLSGPGAFRVTWSHLPDEPFFFPVQFITEDDLAPTCFDEDGAEVACSFGLRPEIQLSRPQSGAFYQPGETVQLRVLLKDGSGALLHDGLLPSYQEMYGNEANGLQYFYPGHFITLQERDGMPSYKVVGPLHKLTAESNLNAAKPYFEFPRGGLEAKLIEPVAATAPYGGLQNTPWPNEFKVPLPPDAEPGTYLALVKAHRFFSGERITKMTAVRFQVGQAEETSYPGNVGNCQICHRGVISLDNVRHGIAGDHVESCKGCHANPGLNLYNEIHAVHMNSAKFSANKADCTTCHLTRVSAVRPSIEVCSSCHPTVHGNEFNAMAFEQSGNPSRYSNCGQSCHVDNLPSSHILPQE